MTMVKAGQTRLRSGHCGCVPQSPWVVPFLSPSDSPSRPLEWSPLTPLHLLMSTLEGSSEITCSVLYRRGNGGSGGCLRQDCSTCSHTLEWHLKVLLSASSLAIDIRSALGHFLAPAPQISFSISSLPASPSAASGFAP